MNTNQDNINKENATSRRDVKTNKLTDEFAFIYPYDEKLKSLASLAQDEEWDFEGKSGHYSILSTYLSQTFIRLKYEDEKLNVGKESKKIEEAKDLTGQKVCTFNTGLKTRNGGDDIYMLFKENNKHDKQPWVFMCFCTRNDSVFSPFAKMAPEPANYYLNMKDTGEWTINSSIENINFGHIFEDHVERFPIGFLKDNFKGFDFPDREDELTGELYDKLKKYISSENGLFELENAQAILRMRIKKAMAEGNYPRIYYPKERNICFYLPIYLRPIKKGELHNFDFGLVVSYERPTSGKGEGHYYARTIYKPSMAYVRIRQIQRTTAFGAWLDPTKIKIWKDPYSVKLQKTSNAPKVNYQPTKETVVKHEVKATPARPVAQTAPVRPAVNQRSVQPQSRPSAQPTSTGQSRPAASVTQPSTGYAQPRPTAQSGRPAATGQPRPTASGTQPSAGYSQARPSAQSEQLAATGQPRPAATSSQPTSRYAQPRPTTDYKRPSVETKKPVSETKSENEDSDVRIGSIIMSIIGCIYCIVSIGFIVFWILAVIDIKLNDTLIDFANRYGAIIFGIVCYPILLIGGIIFIDAIYEAFLEEHLPDSITSIVDRIKVFLSAIFIDWWL